MTSENKPIPMDFLGVPSVRSKSRGQSPNCSDTSSNDDDYRLDTSNDSAFGSLKSADSSFNCSNSTDILNVLNFSTASHLDVTNLGSGFRHLSHRKLDRLASAEEANVQAQEIRADDRTLNNIPHFRPRKLDSERLQDAPDLNLLEYLEGPKHMMPGPERLRERTKCYRVILDDLENKINERREEKIILQDVLATLRLRLGVIQDGCPQMYTGQSN